jgi:HK97 family phage prohead protease
MSKIKIPKMELRAEFSPNSYNKENRTVDVVFATEAPVFRDGWDGPFKEVLSLKENNVRLERALKRGLPLLNNHDKYSGVGAVIGRAESIRFEGKKLTASIRFSQREDVREIEQDVADGILTDISFGYRVYKYEETTGADGEVPTRTATDWEPMEVSFVTIPADYNAGVRSDNGEQYEVEITRKNEEPNIKMTEAEKKALRDAERQRAADITKAVAEAGLSADFARGLIDNENMTVESVRGVITAEKERLQNDPTKAREEGAKAERQRSADIAKAVKAAGLSDEFARGLVENGTAIDAARTAIIEELGKNDPFEGTRSGVKVGTDNKEEMRREATEAALVTRVMPELAKPEKGAYSADVVREANNYRHMTLLDLAKDALVRSGVNIVGMDPMQIVGRAFTSSTSDFPVLLEGTNRRVLLSNYNAVADTWRKFCSTGSLSDFREAKRLRMGTFSDLQSVNENGEFKNKSITDADYEKVSLSTKGNIINVSRQMIINDDLAGFTRLSGMLGRAAARSIENDVYAVLALNSGLGPVLVDGKTLFHADHGNIATDAGAPTVTRFDAMRVQMGKQMDKDENDYLDIRPSLWLGPMNLASTVRILNGSQYDPDATNKLQRPNVVNGLLSDVIDTPRLSGNAYYMFANPGEEPTLEVSFLNGVQTPFMESQNGFEVDGVKWKIRLDYGVGAVGFRGAIRNAGA